MELCGQGPRQCVLDACAAGSGDSLRDASIRAVPVRGCGRQWPLGEQVARPTRSLGGGHMPQLLSSPRCSGTRTRRWITVIVPMAVVLTGSFGTTGAYAAAGGNSASHAASSAADNGNGGGNGGVGQDKGVGNDKHADAAPTTSAADTTASADAGVATSHVASGTAGTSGDPSQPQPLSNADQNPGGANNGGDCGSYCSTRDGSPSGNGNGGGKATGKPCAGCVGKADNKNPKGQFKDGSDHNAGYECDRNHGIGRSNPAHTGCKPPVTTCPAGQHMVNGQCVTDSSGCPEGQHMVNGHCVTDSSGCPEGQHMVNGHCVTDSSGCPEGQTMVDGTCQTPPSTCPEGQHAGADGTCVLGEKHTRKPPTVQGEKVVKTPSSLPMTGADVAAMLMAGVVGIGVGSVLLVAAGRRRRTSN